MLVCGLIAKHAIQGIGKRAAAGSKVRIPKLCAYATAGILAATVRVGLEFVSIERFLIYVIFGVTWGLIVGFMLPFSRPLPAANGS